jgi:hypothetical protein
MSTPIEEYMAVRRQFEEAGEAIDALVAKISNLSATLRGGGWRDVHIAGGNYTSEALGKGIFITDEGWVTRQQLATALSNWYQLKFQCRQAWTRVPDAQQKDFAHMKPGDLES